MISAAKMMIKIIVRMTLVRRLNFSLHFNFLHLALIKRALRRREAYAGQGELMIRDFYWIQNSS
jgi:hypothetical protein